MTKIISQVFRVEQFASLAYVALCSLILLFLISPILVVIPLSFNAEPYFTFTDSMVSLDPSGYSLQWYGQILTFGMINPDAPRDMAWWRDVWSNAQWVQAAKNSMGIGLAATSISTVLGTLAALGLSRAEMPCRRIIMALLISPMIVPVIITATGLFFFYSATGLAQTYLGMILAHATLGTPFVVITVTASLASFDHTLTRAALGLGAGPLTAFRRVTLPLVLPGIMSGAIFAFGTSFDDVVVALFIAGQEQQTIPRQMWNGIREQLSPTILAAATLLVAFSLALLAVIERLRRRSERLSGEPRASTFAGGDRKQISEAIVAS